MIMIMVIVDDSALVVAVSVMALCLMMNNGLVSSRCVKPS